MRVRIPSPLFSYTGQRDEVDVTGETVAALLMDLDRQFPGIRFRMIDEQDSIRSHIRIFVNGEQIRELDTAVQPSDEIQILQALSGG